MDDDAQSDRPSSGLARYGAPSEAVIDAWRLPRGRQANEHSSEIAASQRARLLFAMNESVAQKGYVATTVADITRIARVSRSAFYANFKDKEACFIAAYEAAHVDVVERIRQAQTAAMSWRERLRTTLRVYLAFKRDHPALSRTLLVEIHAAGPRARAKRDWGHQHFAEMQRRLYALRQTEEPGLPDLPAPIFRGVVAAIEEMAATYVCDGRTDEILDLEPAAMLLLEKVYG
ncbi:MAG: TetR/AcrR family transcriptional regulator [Abyssibacter sp.]|uniref:TetR/AcrR family transcriptional regulator n=1 Tax=Abyssibacter sp. TaxID=2320200 RepID=UPI0032192868